MPKQLRVLLSALIGFALIGCSPDIPGDPGVESLARRHRDAAVTFEDASFSPGVIACTSQTLGVNQRCAPQQVCCFDEANNQTGTCQAPGTCSGDDFLACDGPEDCSPGQQCWTTHAGSGTAGTYQASCAASGASGETTLCHVASDCPAGKSCRVSKFLAPQWPTFYPGDVAVCW